MGKVFSGGVEVPTGFKKLGNFPVSDDEVFEFYRDLNPSAYEGSIAYVKESELVYVKKNAGWDVLSPTLMARVLDGEFVVKNTTNSNTHLDIDTKSSYLMRGSQGRINYILDKADSPNYNGREIVICNHQTVDLEIRSNFDVQNPLHKALIIPNSDRIILKSDETATFKYIEGDNRYNLIYTSKFDPTYYKFEGQPTMPILSAVKVLASEYDLPDLRGKVKFEFRAVLEIIGSEREPSTVELKLFNTLDSSEVEILNLDYYGSGSRYIGLYKIYTLNENTSTINGINNVEMDFFHRQLSTAPQTMTKTLNYAGKYKLKMYVLSPNRSLRCSHSTIIIR